MRSTGQLFYTLSPIWVHVIFFSYDETGLCILGRKTPEVKCPSHHVVSWVHIISMIYHCYVNLDHLAEVVFVRFLHYKVNISPPFSHCALWKEVITCSPHLRSEEFCSSSLRGDYLNKLFAILLYGRFIYYPPFICFLNHLFIPVWTWILILYFEL